MNSKAPFLAQRGLLAAVAMAVWVNGGAVADQGTVCPYVPTLAPPNECGLVDLSLMPRGVNNLGQWVGYTSDCDSFKEIAIKWTPETGWLALPVPSDTFRAIAYGINDSGTVVGVRNTLAAGNDHAYIWLGDQGIELPGDGGGASFASAVNNSNWVVGWHASTKPGAEAMGFIWRNGEVTEIDPRPYGRDWADCLDVTDGGWVAGYFGGVSTSNGVAFRWRKDQVEILEPLSGAVNSTAFGIADSGLTVGQCRFLISGGSGFYNFPTIWGSDGQPAALELPAGYNGGGCTDVSNSGMILGFVYKVSQTGTISQTKYVVWVSGKPRFVSQIIQPGAGASFSAPTGLSDARHIVGTGGYPGTSGGGWLLTPGAPAADLNGDCVVDGTDLIELLAAWGQTSHFLPSDLNQSGDVDGADLGILLGEWTTN